MQTTERRVDPELAQTRWRVDPKFARRLVLVNGAVPGLLFLWDALNGDLGANGVNYALHTTGALGLIFLLLSLTVTPLRRITRQPALIATRRTLGLYSFFYLAVHFLIFFAFDRGGSVTSTVHEILVRRYLQIGAAALFLLIPLALTSTDGMITRLGPKRWKRLHRLVYVIAIGGVTHYLMLVKSDIRKPLAYAAVLGVLLGFRVVDRLVTRGVRPSHKKKRFWRGELVVLRTVDETPDVRTFHLALPGGGPLPFEHRPGQYLTLTLEIDGKRVTRSYTIASSPTRADHLEITVKRIADGRGSGHLHGAIREGQRLMVAAPAGRFVFTGKESARVTLIAGGVGITPLMSIIRYLADRAWASPIDLVFVVRKESDIVFRDELRLLQTKCPNLRTCITLTNEASTAWSGKRGRITKELLREFAPDIARGRVYVCGPDAMMDATTAMLHELGVPDESVLTEAFVSPGSARLAEPPARSAIAGATAGAVLGAPRAPAVADADAIDDAGDATVRFERSRVSLPIAPDQTILEVAEDAGIDLQFDCRSGICGQCKTKLLEGDVAMEVEDALTQHDRALGVILACQARAKTSVVIDA